MPKNEESEEKGEKLLYMLCMWVWSCLHKNPHMNFSFIHSLFISYLFVQFIFRSQFLVRLFFFFILFARYHCHCWIVFFFSFSFRFDFRYFSLIASNESKNGFFALRHSQNALFLYTDTLSLQSVYTSVGVFIYHKSEGMTRKIYARMLHNEKTQKHSTKSKPKKSRAKKTRNKYTSNRILWRHVVCVCVRKRVCGGHKLCELRK